MKKHKLRVMVLGIFISLQIIGSNAFAGEVLYKIVGEGSETVCNHCESTFDYDWCSCCYGDHSMATGLCDHEPRNDEDNIPTREELHIPCKCGEAIKNTYLLELPNGDRSNFSYIEKRDKTPIIKVIDGIRYLVIK